MKTIAPHDKYFERSVDHQVMWVLWCLLVVNLYPSTAHAEVNLEAELKTAYLVNIARFTTWPDQDTAKVICISKDSAIFSEVKQLIDHEFSADLSLSIVIDPASLQLCHMYYIDQDTLDGSHEDPLTAPADLLVVSDLSDAHDRGYAIQFFVRNLKLRFSINQNVVKNSNYKISSKLLRLSRQMD